jgi:HAD superfamily hydrolase (TIGR01509 family)
MDLIRSGELPLRPGVSRLMREIKENGIFLGICTTSDQKAAEAVVKRMLEGISVDVLLAGDVVHRKKPDPEIYQLALERSEADPGSCFVIEDSSIGVAAARAAGLHTAATVNEYTRDEDLSGADFVVDSLGEPQGPQARLLQGDCAGDFRGIVDLALLERILD